MPIFCCITEQSAKTKQVMYSAQDGFSLSEFIGILIAQELKHTIFKFIA